MSRTQNSKKKKKKKKKKMECECGYEGEPDEDGECPECGAEMVDNSNPEGCNQYTGPGCGSGGGAKEGGSKTGTKMKWHTFAGGTGAAEGKHSHQANTEHGEYHVQPSTTSSGRHAGYSVKFANTKGKLPGGLWHDLGTVRSPNEAKRIVSEHHQKVSNTTNNQQTLNEGERTMPKATSSMADVSGDDAKNAEAIRKAFELTKAALSGTAQTEQPNATPDSHEAAAAAHKDAAAAHQELATNETEGDLHAEMAKHHEAQAAKHEEVAANGEVPEAFKKQWAKNKDEEGEEEEEAVENRLTANARRRIIDSLIGDCKPCGFTEADRPLLNGMSDQTLRNQNERRKQLVANAKTPDIDEYLKTAPPELRAIVDNHRLAERNRKAEIVRRLTANVGERSRKAQVERLMAKDLAELEQDLALIANSEVVPQAMPTYLGAAAPAFNQMVPVVNEDEDMEMVPSRIDFAEIARDHRQFDDPRLASIAHKG